MSSARELDDLESWIAYGPPAAAGPANAGEAIVAATGPQPERPWRRTARPVQLELAASTSLYTLFLAGRGAGKTWSAAHAFAEWMIAEPGWYGIVAKTFGDCRQTCVEGPSGLLKALGDDVLEYNRSTYEITVRGGSKVIMASDDAPARLRGPNLTGIWCDEVGAWRRYKETWEEGVEFATRVGRARRLVTTTPKRGNKIINELLDRHGSGDGLVTLLRGKTLDNEHLSPTWREAMLAKYAGTTMGRQELDGELLADAEGAIVTTDLIDTTRCRPAFLPELDRIVVAVDPAVTSRENSDHTGIVVVGIGGPPLPGYAGRTATVAGRHLYFLADESVQGTPRFWAERVLKVAEQWAADAIIAEVNQGGDLVETMIGMVAKADGYSMPRYIPVRAAVGKRTRAEPVAGVWEQARIHVVGPLLTGLEDEWSGWVPGSPDSPDSLDASVWGAVGLMPTLAINAPTEVRVLTGRNGLGPARGRD